MQNYYFYAKNISKGNLIDMRLQLSLDLVCSDEAIDDIVQTKDSLDIIEIGTPLVIPEGVKASSVVKNQYPDFDLLADYKIIQYNHKS